MIVYRPVGYAYVDVSGLLGLVKRSDVRLPALPYPSYGKGNKTRYDARDCSRWIAAQKVIKPDTEGDKSSSRYRQEKARIAELQRRRLEGQLVDVDELRSGLLRTTSMIRKGVEHFHREFGNEAVERLGSIIDEVEASLRESLSQNTQS